MPSFENVSKERMLSAMLSQIFGTRRSTYKPADAQRMSANA